jgi:acetoin:2,6-dichlorophenolindophenol oxidoreductase subunit beta
MTYKEMISQAYYEYWVANQCYFIGYNTAKGSRMYVTLARIPVENCIEMPICESLMMGIGIGLSAFSDIKTVVCFERHDFLFGGMDQLVNHLDKMAWITDYAITCPVIVRAIVGSSIPLDPGVQHKQNYTAALKKMLIHTPVVEPKNYVEILAAMAEVDGTDSGAVVIVEHRDWYDKQV